MRKSAMVVLLLILLVNSGFSQAPQLINYQAVARNQDGSPIRNTTIGLMISILEGSATGTTLYSEKHTLLTDDFGLLNIRIGSGTSDDDFGIIPWEKAGNLWLEVKLDIDHSGNFIIMGTTQLVSVPYALHSASAGSAPPVLKSMTDSERDALVSPTSGSMIFNSSTGSLNVYRGGNWWQAELTKIETGWSCGQPFTDNRDNHSYKSVSIGGKCWMAENLNIGQFIAHTTEQSDNSIIEKYCYNNDPANCTTYGGLYQWDEAMNYSKVQGSQGICPEGWHLPTDQEWQNMEISLGMTASEAAMSNTWRGTDQGTQLGPGGSAGYNTLYCGRSVPGFGFTALSSYEYVWTSNESGFDAWRRCLNITDPKIGRYNTFPKQYGMSVRCIK